MSNILLQPIKEKFYKDEKTISGLRLRDRLWVNNHYLLPECSLYRIVYAGNIWPKDADRSQLPPEQHFKDLILQNTSNPYVLDIEHWPWDIRSNSTVEVDETISKLSTLLSWCRDVNPNGDYGFYSVGPIRDYWTPVSGDEGRINLWKNANDYLKPLADVCDSFYPSLYTFYDNQEGWKKYAKANIIETRRLANGKGIRPFVWPRYHNSNAELGFQSVPGDYWMLQLMTLASARVDAIFAWDWSGFVTEENGREDWTDESEFRVASRYWARSMSI